MWATHNETIQYGTDTKQTPSTVCSLQFVIPEDIGPPVLFYYRLTNFYQNHRRYVKSLDTDQLKGKAVSNKTISGGSCDPLRLGSNGKPYYPCGLIANSLFNDSFRELRPLNSRNNETVYPLKSEGIAWSSDKALYGNTSYKPEEIAVPPNWMEQWPNGYTNEHPPPNLDTWEEFQVWMRTAGLPAFSKLAKRNDDDTLKCGVYGMEVVLSMLAGITDFWMLMCARLSGHGLRRNQSDCDIYSNSNGREESIPRHRLCRRGRHLHCPGCPVHSSTSHQAEVFSVLVSATMVC